MGDRLFSFCFDDHQVQYREKYVQDENIEKYYEIKNPNRASIVEIPQTGIDVRFVWNKGELTVFITGLKKAGELVRYLECDVCFGVRLKRGYMFERLIGMMESISGSNFKIEDINQIPAELRNLSMDTEFEKKIKIVDSQLHMREISQNSYFINSIMKMIERDRGCVVVSNIIDEVGYSHRYVEATFRKAVGVSIKRYAGIVRMQRSLDYVLEGKIEEALNDFEYYDKSHFIRDFKNFTTFTPGKLHSLVSRRSVTVV